MPPKKTPVPETPPRESRRVRGLAPLPGIPGLDITLRNTRLAHSRSLISETPIRPSSAPLSTSLTTQPRGTRLEENQPSTSNHSSEHLQVCTATSSLPLNLSSFEPRQSPPPNSPGSFSTARSGSLPSDEDEVNPSPASIPETQQVSPPIPAISIRPLHQLQEPIVPLNEDLFDSDPEPDPDLNPQDLIDEFLHEQQFDEPHFIELLIAPVPIRNMSSGGGAGGQGIPAANAAAPGGAAAAAQPQLPNIIVYNEPIPKYTQPLSKKALELYFTRYEAWARQKGYDDEQKKQNVQLAITNVIAQQWFTIHADEIDDRAVTWLDFRDAFLQSCPMENKDDDMTYTEIMTLSQGKGELASLFIQKIRYLLGPEWQRYPERDLVEAMTKQLNSNTRRYLECRGIPDTYDQMTTYIKQYEKKGGSKDIDNDVKVKIEAPVNMATLITPEVKALQDSMQTMTLDINYLKNNQSSGNNRNQRPANNFSRNNFNSNRGYSRPFNRRGRSNFNRQRNFNNVPKCYYCGKLGHVISVCRTRTFQQRGGLRGGYRGYTNYYQQQPRPETQQALPMITQQGEAPYQGNLYRRAQ